MLQLLIHRIFLPNKYYMGLGIILLSIGLSSCGFKLKEYQALHPSLRNIEINAEGRALSFAYPLEKALKNRGIKVFKGAPVQLNITHYSQSKSGASLSANTSRRLETRVSTSLSYNVVRVNIDTPEISSEQSIDKNLNKRSTNSTSTVKATRSALLIAPQQLQLSKEYSNDNNNISAKAEEERLILKEIDQDLIKKVIASLENSMFQPDPEITIDIPGPATQKTTQPFSNDETQTGTN